MEIFDKAFNVFCGKNFVTLWISTYEKYMMFNHMYLPDNTQLKAGPA